MSKLNVEAGFDTGPVVQGTQTIAQAVGKMADKVEAEGKRASKGLEGAAAGADQAAAKIDRDAGRMAASIQRATAAAESGGRSTAAYFESIARQRGIPADTLRPYLDQLRQAETAQRAAGVSLDGMGLSAKQTAAAMRGVPAQFTDIFTSIQGGQAPLTVFLQQGGQLKDMFGGAGNAARAMAGYVAGLVTPFTLVVAAAAAAGLAFEMGQRESAAYTQALVISGNAMGTTTAKLAGMAQAINQAGGATQGRAAELLASMAGAAGLTADNLQRMASAALEFERAGGPAAEKTAEAFAELGKKPLEAALKLNEAQNFLTRTTYEQIKALSEQGRTTDAARAAQDAYAAALEERAPKMLATLGFVDRAWKEIRSTIGAAADAVKNIGRDTTATQIAALEQQLGMAQRAKGSDGTGLLGVFGKSKEEEIKRAIADLRLFQALEEDIARKQAESARQLKARAEFDKGGLEFLDTRAKLERDIAAARNQGVAAGASEIEIQQRIAEIRKKALGADNNKAAQELQAQAKLLNELAGLTGTYAQDVERLNASRKRGVIDEERYGQLMRELVARQPFAKAAAKELADAADLEAKAVNDAEKARTSHLRALDGTIVRGADVLTNLREEIIGLTQGKAVLADRVALRLQEQASALELQAIRLDDREIDSQEALALRERAQQLREEARLRKDLASAVSAKEVTEANARTAKEAAREWERVTDQVGQSLADALMQGGKSASQYIKDLFRTMVLRPVLQAVVKDGTNAVSSLLGGSGLTAGNFVGAASSYYAAASGSAYGTNFGSEQSRMLAAQDAGLNSGASAASSAASGNIYAAIIAAALKRGSTEWEQGWTDSVARASKSNILGKDAIGQSFSKFSVDALLTDFGKSIGLSDKWASILSGETAIAQLIGRQAPRTTGTGITGTLGGGDFEGQAFREWLAKGGIFRSDKRGTDYAALGAADEAKLDNNGKALLSAVTEWASILGLPVQQLQRVSTAVRVTFTGNAEQDEKAIQSALKTYGDALSGTFETALQPFKNAGEEVTETLQRLAGLQSFSRTINDMGGIFSRVAVLGFDARQSLFEMAGGIEAFAQQAQGFISNYYTRDEIAGVKARDVQSVLGSVGITQDVNTRDQFRALVEGANVGTDQGRQQLATLLGLQGDFAQVADYLASTSRTLTDAAALAPQSAILQSLLDQSGQTAQIDAINNVGNGVGMVVDAVRELIEVVRSGGGVFTPQWEVVQP